MARRPKRKGATVTFSVSVDRETKKILKSVAGRSYRGNVSQLISHIARQAARQEAAAELLRSHGRRPMTDDEYQVFEAQIAAELARQRPRKQHRSGAA